MKRLWFLLLVLLFGCASNLRLVDDRRTICWSETGNANQLFLEKKIDGTARVKLGSEHVWAYRDEVGKLLQQRTSKNERVFLNSLDSLFCSTVSMNESCLTDSFESVLPEENCLLPVTVRWRALATVAVDDDGNEIAVIASRLVLQTSLDNLQKVGPCFTLVQQLSDSATFWDSVSNNNQQDPAEVGELLVEGDSLEVYLTKATSWPIKVEVWDFHGNLLNGYVIGMSGAVPLPQVQSRQLWVRVYNGCESRVYPILRP